MDDEPDNVKSIAILVIILVTWLAGCPRRSATIGGGSRPGRSRGQGQALGGRRGKENKVPGGSPRGDPDEEARDKAAPLRGAGDDDGAGTRGSRVPEAAAHHGAPAVSPRATKGRGVPGAATGAPAARPGAAPAAAAAAATAAAAAAAAATAATTAAAATAATATATAAAAAAATISESAPVALAAEQQSVVAADGGWGATRRRGRPATGPANLPAAGAATESAGPAAHASAAGSIRIFVDAQDVARITFCQERERERERESCTEVTYYGPLIIFFSLGEGGVVVNVYTGWELVSLIALEL
jgi:hypothetical protein